MNVLRFIMAISLGVALLFVTGIPQDAYRRSVNKCSQVCLVTRQHPKVRIVFKLPVFECGCGGFRMPDDYLIKR